MLIETLSYVLAIIVIGRLLVAIIGLIKTWVTLKNQGPQELVVSPSRARQRVRGCGCGCRKRMRLRSCIRCRRLVKH